MLFFYTIYAQAGQLTLAWDASIPSSTNVSVSGYRLSYGPASGNYTDNQDVGNQLMYTLGNLQDGQTYYFAVMAYGYDSTGTLIQSGFSNEVNQTISSGDTTPPTVTTISPPRGATGVSQGTTVTATFSEALNTTTINTSTFMLQNASTTVSAAVTYNAATLTATLTPNSALAANTSYTATLTTGVQDLAGNALASNVTWSFTTGSSSGDTTPPTVTTISPPSGATGVSQGTTVTATFSEALNTTTINTSTFMLQNASTTVPAVVSAAVTYNAATLTATLTPNSALAANTSYTATLTTGVQDLAGNALTADVSWSFTTGSGPTGAFSTWSSSTIPTNPSVADPNSVELGVKFKTDLDGFITGIRFYKGSSNTGTHVGTLWSSSGQRLATATFTNETDSGWQQVSFATPVAITANTVYVASYHTNVGHYAYDTGYFATSYDNPPLHALRDGASGYNGVYQYGKWRGFPTNGYQSSNYWVDVVFTPQ